MNKYFQSVALPGNDIYNNPDEIFNPGHKKYSSTIVDGSHQGISGIAQNIKFLNNSEKLPNTNFQKEDTGVINTKRSRLIEDKTVPPGYNAYSIDLDTGDFQVKTDGNVYIDL